MSIHDETMDLGLAFMTGGLVYDEVGATSGDYKAKITALDDKIKGKDDDIFHWQLEKYSPGGILAIGETSNSQVTKEQEYYKTWQKFVADWQHKRDGLVASLSGPLGVDETVESDAGTAIDRILAVSQAQYDEFKSSFEKLKAEHDKAKEKGDIPVLAAMPKPIPWGKIALGAAALIGAFVFLKWLGKRAERKALEDEARLALPEGEEDAGRSAPPASGRRVPPVASRAFKKLVDSVKTGRNPLMPEATMEPHRPSTTAPPMPPMDTPPVTERAFVASYGGSPMKLLEAMGPPESRRKTWQSGYGGPSTKRDTQAPPTVPMSAPPTLAQ